jgi:vacuolar-type H+-ATPase subunit E/Vma4
MSEGTQQTGTTARARETLKSVKELLTKAEESTQRALNRASPAIQKSVDVSMQAASKGFTATMRAIESAAVEDQVKLLKVYRKFLSGQVQFVDSRITSLDKGKNPGEQRSPDEAQASAPTAA